MSPDEKAGAIVSSPEGSEHFKEIIKRGRLPLNHATCPFGGGKLRENLSNVIGYLTLLNVRAAKDMPDKDVKVKSARHLQTAPAFEQGVEESFVIEDQIARLFVG